MAATTMGAKDFYTDTLQADNQVTFITAASSTAIVERWLGTSTLVDSKSMAASTTYVLGEYRQDFVYRVNVLTGSLTREETTSTALITGRAAKTGTAIAAGEIGEVITATVAVGAPVSETTATPVNVTSITVTPGTWLISGQVDRVLTGTTATIYGAAINVTTGTLPSQAGGSGIGTDPITTCTATFGVTLSGNYATKIGPVPCSFTTSTVVYLIAGDSFSAGSVGVYGTITAVRQS